MIIAITALNILFSAVFPLLYALLSGLAADGAPRRGPRAVIPVLAVWAIVYIFIIIWRVVLRSPNLRLNAPLPAAGPDFNIKTDIYEKNSVDTAHNIDKMDISNKSNRNYSRDDVDFLINHAFDSLHGGNLEEAAEYFYNAIELNPPLNLELLIAVQLSVIYCDLGHPDLSSDIMDGYYKKYWDILSDSDKAVIMAGVSIIESKTAGIGGDGNEKD